MRTNHLEFGVECEQVSKFRFVVSGVHRQHEKRSTGSENRIKFIEAGIINGEGMRVTVPVIKFYPQGSAVQTVAQKRQSVGIGGVDGTKIRKLLGIGGEDLLQGS